VPNGDKGLFVADPGRDCADLSPGQVNIASTVVAFGVEPLSPLEFTLWPATLV
jgi:hypothetical protein